MNTEYKTFTRYFLSPKVKYNNSLRASSPFEGYREKYTREWHARGDATVPWPLAASPLARAFSRARLALLAHIGELARRLVQ